MKELKQINSVNLLTNLVIKKQKQDTLQKYLMDKEEE
jgi:hypothetical protein